MSKEKILLLCDIPPCKNYTGGIMNTQLLEFLFEEGISVSSVCIMDYNLQPVLDTDMVNKLSIKYYKKSSEIIENEKEEKYYYKNIRNIIKGVCRYVKKGGITKIWCPLQGEVLTKVLYEVHKRCGVSYVVQIWDPIEWWIRDHKFSDSRKESTLKVHNEVLKNASCCITTSNAMSKYFKDKLGINCISVMPPLKRKSFDVCHSNDKYIIAMSGQVYAKDELDSFLTALDMLEWKVDGKDVYFEHFGSWSPTYIDFSKHSKYRDRIILRGFINQNDLLYELSKTNLLYCPYFFSDDENLKMVSSLSFPSKVVTYLALEVPTLIHGPEYASPYIFLKENNCAYLLGTNDPIKIKDKIVEFTRDDCSSLIENAKRCFDNNFTYEVVKDNFFKALDLKYDKNDSLKILEVNNLDLLGRRFNGYDLLDTINNNSVHSAKQIVTFKSSSNPNVLEFYKSKGSLFRGDLLVDSELSLLSVHSQVSFTSNILKNSEVYKKSDLVHYHLIHNTKLSLPQMVELCREKPTVLTFHDAWNFTGRCVQPQECEKWKSGCDGCKNLSSLFPFTEDNCASLWNQKMKIYEKMDVDIIVSSLFMKEMLEASPLTKHFKNVHFVPFGIDLDKFKSKDKKQARKSIGIDDEDFVLFFRSEPETKGVEYIIEAMKMLDVNKKITLLTCSCVGLVDELSSKYKVIDLGKIDEDEVINAMNACDVFLMPSLGESFGLMAVEAMACAKPVIVFDNTSLPSISFAPECGVLVENKNSLKLMEAIKNLIDNPQEILRRGKLGRELAEKNYDIKDYNRKIIEVYEKAYERQKSKVIKSDFSKSIDWTNPQVQALIPKLEKIFHSTFADNDFPHRIAVHKNEFIKCDPSLKIDYSSSDIIGLIKIFNDDLYDKLCKSDEFHFSSRWKKIKYYLGNTSELYTRVLEKIHNRYLHKIMEIIFKVFGKIGRLFHRGNLKKIKEENDKLKFEIENTREIIRQLYDK